MMNRDAIIIERVLFHHHHNSVIIIIIIITIIIIIIMTASFIFCFYLISRGGFSWWASGKDEIEKYVKSNDGISSTNCSALSNLLQAINEVLSGGSQREKAGSQSAWGRFFA